MTLIDPRTSLDDLRRQIALAASNAGEGHVPSALSVLDILWVEYTQVMPAQREASQAVDRFVLSKGHASLGLYAILASTGVIPSEWLEDFGSFTSPLGGHPDMNKVPGVEASTGSLGHGFPIGAGMALAGKIKKTPGRIVVLIGDGEANEGTTWETALIAAHHHLDNLVCIIDHNHSTDRALLVDPLGEKFASFGWSVVEVDGHDHQALADALAMASPGLPLAILANTIKGKGIAVMENNPAWHHASPTADELESMFEVQS